MATDNKRIAKNTLLLYLRTILTMCISIYTYRVVLQALGIENYGIYNIVGGFVGLFAVVSQTMVATTQRYLTYELGKKDCNSLSRVFSAAMIIHIVLAVVLLLLFESIGLWFVNSHLNIPETKVYATNCIFQFSIFTFLVGIIRSPFIAVIIAYEKMSIFAYITIIEAVIKLLISYTIFFSSSDRLIIYGFYLLLLSLAILLIYAIYVKFKIPAVKIKFVKDTNLYRSMTKFASYNFLGASSAIISRQGTNVLLNIFFGVTINAAKGVAEQVESAVSIFINDFTTALNPQITKSYASGKKLESVNLAFMGAKFSFYLYCIIGIPLFLQADYILSLWLNEVPPYAVVFVKWSLVIALLNTFANPLTTSAFATGHIKKLSLWIGTIRLFVVPVSYVLLLFTPNPIIVFVILFLVDVLLFFVRLKIVSDLMGVEIRLFSKDVLVYSFRVLLLSVFLSILISDFIGTINFVGFLLFSVLSCMISVFLIYTIGLKKHEREMIVNIVKSKISIHK